MSNSSRRDLPPVPIGIEQTLRVQTIPKGLTLTIYDVNASGYGHDGFKARVELPNSAGVYGTHLEEDKKAHLPYTVSASDDPQGGIMATVKLKSEGFVKSIGSAAGFAEIFYRLHGTTKTASGREVKIDTKGTIGVHTTDWKLGERPDTCIISYGIACHAAKMLTLDVPKLQQPQSVSFCFAVDTDAEGATHVAVIGVPTERTVLEKISGTIITGILEFHKEGLAAAAGAAGGFGAVRLGFKTAGAIIGSHAGAWSIGKIL
ncbi:hypothetical protein HGRIS_012296 [Hohenbuehelia grisea]|uniref:Uncharacterized protein n=1 Tax=Hohenbuehelia grisea TaxID=104357 RepID=A0ABR3IRX1_9AGAR